MCTVLHAVINFCRSFLIEEKCRFLSNFSLQTAEVELPGEFLLPKVQHFAWYYEELAILLHALYSHSRILSQNKET